MCGFLASLVKEIGVSGAHEIPLEPGQECPDFGCLL